MVEIRIQDGGGCCGEGANEIRGVKRKGPGKTQKRIQRVITKNNHGGGN